MKRYSLAVWIFICALSICVAGEIPKQSPKSSGVPFLKPMPDFCQLDQRFGRLPGGGSQYCAPVAISNALIWFHEHGFPNLAPPKDCIPRSQFEMIKNLGSGKYMKTDKETGTSPLETMEGLEKYVRDRGYDIAVEWKGWREGGKFASPEQTPTLEWLANSVTGPSNIVISVGWYKFDPKKKMYDRLGGHYVTVVGVDTKDKKGPILFIHNPSFGTDPGKTPKPQVCRLVPIREGYFGSWCEYHPRSTKGYFTIEEIPMRDDADVAILDGAIRFSISHPEERNYSVVDPYEDEVKTDM